MRFIQQIQRNIEKGVITCTIYTIQYTLNTSTECMYSVYPLPPTLYTQPKKGTPKDHMFLFYNIIVSCYGFVFSFLMLLIKSFIEQTVLVLLQYIINKWNFSKYDKLRRDSDRTKKSDKVDNNEKA